LIEHLTTKHFCFKEKDGIRERNVTGVQTCALPIWTNGDIENTRKKRKGSPYCHAEQSETSKPIRIPPLVTTMADKREKPRPFYEIGRASCREKVESSKHVVHLET